MNIQERTDIITPHRCATTHPNRTLITPTCSFTLGKNPHQQKRKMAPANTEAVSSKHGRGQVRMRRRTPIPTAADVVRSNSGHMPEEERTSPRETTKPSARCSGRLRHIDLGDTNGSFCMVLMWISIGCRFVAFEVETNHFLSIRSVLSVIFDFKHVFRH